MQSINRKVITKRFFVIMGAVTLFACSDLSTSSPKKSTHAPNTNTNTNTNTNNNQLPPFHSDYLITKILHCNNTNNQIPNTVSILGFGNKKVSTQELSDLQFSAWNHTHNGNSSEWTGLSQTAAAYDFNKINIDKECNNAAALNMVLIKKIANWDHQHSNGFERNIRNKNITFDAVDNIILDLKINSAHTRIPTIESLKEIYADKVPASAIDALDAGKVNIGITLHDGNKLNASTIIELDQTQLMDQWVRVSIPVNTLKFYSETNYVRTPLSAADLKAVTIQRLLVVAETRTGSVLRGKMKDWNPNVTERFKEMDLSFKRIDFQLR